MRRWNWQIVLGVFLGIEAVCVLGVASFAPMPPALLGGLMAAGFLGALVGGYLVGLIGVLLIVRNMGYRLHWGRRTGPVVAESDTQDDGAAEEGDDSATRCRETSSAQAEA